MLLIRPDDIVVPPVTQPVTPHLTLVQEVSGSNTRTQPSQVSGTPPLTFTSQFPATTQAGNLIVARGTFTNNTTLTVTDDATGGSNAYTTQLTHDATAGRTIYVATCANCSAGARTLTFTFGVAPGNWTACGESEFANGTGVGTAVVQHGTGTTATANPTLSGNDVAYQYTVSTSGSQSSWATTGTFLAADRLDGAAAQYGASTMTLGTSDTWLSIAIPIHVGATGSAPSKRIIRYLHNNIPVSVNAGDSNTNFASPLTVQFPCGAGTALLFIQVGGLGSITSVSDSNSNPWSVKDQFDDSTNDMGVSCGVALNPATSSGMTFTMVWSATNNDQSVMLVEAVGYTSFDQAGHDRNTDSDGAGLLTVPHTAVSALTPATSPELWLIGVSFGSNTATTQSPGNVMTNLYAGQTINGPTPIDENNWWGVHFSSTTTAFRFVDTLISAGTTGPWTGTWIALK